MCWTPPYTGKHNIVCVGHHHTQVSTTQYVLDTTMHKYAQHNMRWTLCVWWCPTHIMLCLLVYGGVQHILCCAYLCMVVSNTYYVVLYCAWWCPTHIVLCLLVTPLCTSKHNTICVGNHHAQVNTTQYVLDTTMHK
jgi:hypothetical protein